jgi:hypothetical protein
MVLVTIVAMIVVMDVARMFVDANLNAVDIDGIAPAMPAGGEDGDTRDRCAARDDPEADE